MFIVLIVFIVFASIYLFVSYAQDQVINHIEAAKAYIEAAKAAYDNEDVVQTLASIDQNGENTSNKPWDYYTGSPESSDNGPVHTHLERVAKVAWYENGKRAKVYCLRYLVPGQKPTTKKYTMKTTQLYENLPA